MHWNLNRNWGAHRTFPELQYHHRASLRLQRQRRKCMTTKVDVARHMLLSWTQGSRAHWDRAWWDQPHSCCSLHWPPHSPLPSISYNPFFLIELHLPQPPRFSSSSRPHAIGWLWAWLGKEAWLLRAHSQAPFIFHSSISKHTPLTFFYCVEPCQGNPITSGVTSVCKDNLIFRD
jgi:hypothetical protein